MKTRLMSALSTLFAAATVLVAQDPTPTTITYQGRLTAGDKPANGVYDLDFHLFSASTGGTEVAAAFAGGTGVSNGVFTARFDLGTGNADFRTFDAQPRWLEIRMRPSAQPNAPFSVLSPRQPVTSAPKAVYAYQAGQADFAQETDHAKTADMLLGGVAEAQIPSTIARLGANQTFLANNFFQGILLAPNAANAISGSFSGTGTGLSGLNASGIASGTVADARLSSNVALLDTVQAFSALKLFNGKLGIGLAPIDGVLAIGGDAHLADSNLYLRGGEDQTHGLGWFGGKTKFFANLAPNGPVLFGAGGGVLGTTGSGAKAVLSWNQLGRVGINAPTPDTALQIEDFDATLRLKNWNDTVGGFVGNSYSALQLGLYNPTGLDDGAVPANNSRTFFAMASDGRVGSTANFFVGAPAFRNLLDDGAGQVAVNGIVRTAATGTTLELRVATVGASFAPALRLTPTSSQLGPNVNVVAGSPANSVVSTASGSSILGGGASNNPNTIGASAATIAGGIGNIIDVSADLGTIGGGAKNRLVAGAQYASIAGGNLNTVDKSGAYAMVPGGIGNTAGGIAALAAGYNAKAIHDGAFVWADNYLQLGTHPAFTSQAANEFAVRATGGTRLVSGYVFNSTANAYLPTGVSLAAGSGTWSQLSDRNAKTNFAAVRPREILAKVAALPIGQWNYRTESDAVRHVGPVAQDFRAAFGLGHGDTTIDTVDADGIAIAAIQGLNQKVEEQAAEIRELKALLGTLARRIESSGRRAAAATGEPAPGL